MSVSREEIIDLALRYITQDEIKDFPIHNDLFCLLMRETPTDKPLKDDEGWVFGGYGICNHYSFDEEAKPRGKWLWMHFASLASFPPLPQVLKLQPPHVAKGRFNSADRTHEIKIIKIVTDSLNVELAEKSTSKSSKNKNTKTTSGDNIIAFRKKTSK